MNKLFKKLLCAMFAGILVFSMSAGSVSASKVSSLKFVVKNCNVTLEKTTAKDVTYSYNDKLFTIERNVSGSTEVVSIKLKDGASAGLFDEITVYVPDQKYDKIIIEDVKAGVSLPNINTNYDITCDDGAISFNVLKNYDKTLNCTMNSGAGSFKFPADAKNYTIKLNVTSSTVSVPSTFTKYSSAQENYTHVNGDGTAKFNITVKSSALSIKCE